MGDSVMYDGLMYAKYSMSFTEQTSVSLEIIVIIAPKDVYCHNNYKPMLV